MLDLAGGAEKLCVKMEAALKEGNWQWALELAEVLLDTGHNLPLAKVIFLDFFTFGLIRVMLKRKLYFTGDQSDLLGTPSSGRSLCLWSELVLD